MNLADLPIYVISLPRAKQRQQTIKKRLDDLGLNFEFIAATDDRVPLNDEELDLIGREHLHKYSGKLLQGAVGCLISHLRCYKKLLASDAPYVLILEDDAILGRDFLPVLKHITQTKARWHLLRLGYWSVNKETLWWGKSSFPLNIFSKKPIQLQQLNKKHLIGPLALDAFGTHAYLISRYGAKYSLAKYRGVFKPIDWLMNASQLDGHWAVAPSVASQSPGKGDIIAKAWRPVNKDLPRPSPIADRAESKSIQETLLSLPVIRHLSKLLRTRFWRIKTNLDVLYRTRPKGRN